MADEVIISERAAAQTFKNGQILNIAGDRITTQVLDTAVLSAPFSTQTTVIRITANAVPIWYKIGNAAVSAAANTDGNEFLPANESIDEPVKAGQFIDTAADA